MLKEGSRLARSARSLLVATFFGMVLAAPLPAGGTEAKAPSNAQLLEMIQALQARVTALETRNRTYRQEAIAARKDADAARLQLASLTREPLRPTDERLPMSVGEPEPVAGTVVMPTTNGWSGLYFGTSFGLGSTSASSRVQGIATHRLTATSFIGTSTQEGFNGVSGTDHGEGALIDLYLGYNKRLTPRTVVGLQIEGTLSQVDFGSRVNGTRFSQTPQAGFPTIAITESSSALNRLEAEWMVSALGRAGWLVNPSTLFYGLAGVTYGHFELSEAFPENDNAFFSDGLQRTAVGGFESAGLTVGAGIEKRLSPYWSLRGEYRYTRFREKDIEENDGRSRLISGIGNFPGSSQSDVHSLSAVSSFENEMHIGRIGVTRYFNLGK